MFSLLLLSLLLLMLMLLLLFFLVSFFLLLFLSYLLPFLLSSSLLWHVVAFPFRFPSFPFPLFLFGSLPFPFLSMYRVVFLQEVQRPISGYRRKDFSTVCWLVSFRGKEEKRKVGTGREEGRKEGKLIVFVIVSCCLLFGFVAIVGFGIIVVAVILL